MELTERGKQIRRDTLMLAKDNGGYHFGGSFSIVEILIALYDEVIADDDIFLLSKGHACFPLYVILKEMGLNPRLSGHPSMDIRNGIEFTSGSEGHGLPVAIGMAWGRKLRGKPGRVFVLIGDGECQEGTTWESLLTAPYRKLNNLVCIVDWNKIQGSGFIKDILPIPGLASIARIAGWEVDVVDGHDIDALIGVINHVCNSPKLIITNTVKGKGVSYMENVPKWHACFPSPEQFEQALEELK